MRSLGARGQVIPLVALSMTVMMGFSGLGLDVGYWEYQEEAQQSATDAAAIGGVQQLQYDGCPNLNDAVGAADADAARNGYSNAGNVNVNIVVNNPPTSGPYAGVSCAVFVQITTAHVASYFSRLFGFGTGATITTQAIATLTSNGTGCIYMLETGQNTNFNGSNIDAPNCAILLNGSGNFNGATVDAAMIGEGNYSGSNNSGTFTQASPRQILPVADPCMKVAGCRYITENPPATSPCTGTYSGNGALSPGCYNNLNLNGATVTFSSGLYVFTGGPNLNKASITANNCTIYIPAGTSINFNKVNALTLSAPITGDYAGVSYYQVVSNTGDVNFNSSTTNVSGLLYAPGAQLNYNGSSDNYTVVVAGYGNLNSSGGEDFATPPPGAALLTEQAILAQ